MLPELDIAAFRAAPDSRAARAFVRSLRDACREPGFCYLTGHGVAPELDASLLRASREFFALPVTERRALAIANSPHFRGYTALGGERTQGFVDWREQLDIGPEEPAHEVAPGDPPWLKLRGPNQWPPSLPGLRAAVLEWMAAMDSLGLAVLRALALGLGQRQDHFDDAVLPRGDPHLKIVRYPAQPAAADSAQGVGMHHDSGLVSFVLQDDVPGLEVQTERGIVAAVPRPGTYVVNLGEMLQAATAGYLSATKHRVVSPPAGRERISVAYFFHPRLESVFEPIALPEELAAKARGGQNADPSNPVLERFGDNYLKVRLRSHRDVAEAHYARRP